MLGDAPLVEDMLLLLALKEEGKEALDLYPAPAVNLARTWPEINAGEFALPGLPEVSEEEWPNIENTEPAEWILEFSGQDAVGEFFRGRQLSWSQQVPATRESLWAVVTDLDGSLAFSLAVGDFDPEAKGEIRRLLEIMVEEGEQPAEPLAGLLQLNFHKSEEE